MKHSARTSHRKAGRLRRPAAVPASPDLPNPTLAQQKAEFTAEGAPPPGKVATDIPATPGSSQAEAAMAAGVISPAEAAGRPASDVKR